MRPPWHRASCAPGTVGGFSIPLQHAYLDNYKLAGSKPGNGGFFFSCYLGAYLPTRDVSTRILGITMRDAVSNMERWKRRREPTQDPSADLSIDAAGI